MTSPIGVSDIFNLPREVLNAQDGDDLLHVVCCDPNTARCGADVTREPWCVGEATCRICAIADAEFPCSICAGGTR